MGVIAILDKCIFQANTRNLSVSHWNIGKYYECTQTEILIENDKMKVLKNQTRGGGGGGLLTSGKRMLSHNAHSLFLIIMANVMNYVHN